ncbi:MAG: hypothetical protein ACR2OZ_11655 [Verrucomicrobiales bacterium]
MAQQVFDGGSGMPASLWVLLTVLVAALWVASHAASRQLLGRLGLSASRRALAFMVRTTLGTLALWAFWQLLSHFIVLETTWPPLASGMIGALAIEMVMALYAWERRVLQPRVGRTLLALRVAAVAVVLLILAQPVLAWMQSRKIERRVAVLIDDSESMQLADRQMTASEKLEVAAFYRLAAATKRPGLHTLLEISRNYQSPLAQEVEKWRVSDGAVAETDQRWVDPKRGDLNKVIDQGLQLAGSAAQIVADTRKDEQRLDDITRRLLGEMQTTLHEQFGSELREARNQLGQNRARSVQDHLKRAADLLRQSLESLPGIVLAVDNAFLKSLSDAERQKIDEAAMVPRSKLAHEVMARADGPSESLFNRLRGKYDVTCFRFGKTATEVADVLPPTGSPGTEFRMRTDVAGALEHAMQTIPAENLAGVLLLSDGRHNGDKSVDDAARALGIQGSPLHAVAIGSAQGPKDAAFLKVDVPESIYLGDRLKIKADIKADGMKGAQLKITLKQGQEIVDTQKVSVPEETHRATVRLAYTPPAKGVSQFSVKIDPIEGELFQDNNEWEFETAVTDDRTNVLLVESYPRWEFRYLRNLFYARDKSVHLQYVLLKPDQIKGQDALPRVAASAGREFGDAEATALPASPEEWLKFDVMILGDIQPGGLGTEAWQIIEKCVGERGAMIVVIAGPRAMPHAYSNDVVKRLLPVEYAIDANAVLSSAEPSYSLRLTAEGRNSRILQQSPSSIENAEIWAGLPKLMWRHPIRGIKPGAEVLAYAEVEGRRLREATTAEDTLKAFAQQRQIEAQQALLVTSRYGLGKVAMLNFDQTWRLRYGIGDVYHHRFWGNLLRWGTGENLRAGTEEVRLGTDKLTYETGEPVKVLAKLTADGFKPQTNAQVTALVFDADRQMAARRLLTYREGSNGIYEADLPAEALRTIGRFRVQLAGDDVDRLLRGGSVDHVETHFTRLATTTPVELGDLALDSEFLQKAAALSSGSVSTINQAAALAHAFGAESKTVEERKETTLWDNWILLVTAVGLLTSEWIIRRRVGIA